MKEFIVSNHSEFSSLDNLLDSIDKSSYEDIIIYLKSGIYHEKVEINQSNITIIGEGIDNTIIEYDDYSKKIHKDGNDYNTFRTPSVKVFGNNIKFFNLTIKNPSKSKICGQAVALAIYGNNFYARNIKLSSYQDTLLLGPLPDDLKERYYHFLTKKELFIEGNLYSRFDECIIQGDVDFIFGCGSSLFNKCEIESIGEGYVCAPSHSLFQENGFIFNECNFISNNINEQSVYLGRLWRGFGKAVFINNNYGKHIKKEGFEKWNNIDPFTYSRFYEYPLLKNREKYVKEANFKECFSSIKSKFNFL